MLLINVTSRDKKCGKSLVIPLRVFFTKLCLVIGTTLNTIAQKLEIL